MKFGNLQPIRHHVSHVGDSINSHYCSLSIITPTKSHTRSKRITPGTLTLGCVWGEYIMATPTWDDDDRIGLPRGVGRAGTCCGTRSSASVPPPASINGCCRVGSATSRRRRTSATRTWPCRTRRKSWAGCSSDRRPDYEGCGRGRNPSLRSRCSSAWPISHSG